MSLNVPGLVAMAAFYLLILGTGIWAAMRSKTAEKKCPGDGMEITLLAGRNINLLVGIFTLTGKAVRRGQLIIVQWWCVQIKWLFGMPEEVRAMHKLMFVLFNACVCMFVFLQLHG